MTASHLDDQDVVIVAAARTPMGGFQGTLASKTGTELGSEAITAAISRATLSATDIDEVLMGNVLAAGLGQAPARQAALGAGLSDNTPCTTVSKVCGSGMKAVMLAFDQIKAGSCTTAVAGGMESMTNAPYFLPKARSGMRLGHADVKEHMMFDGLDDAYTRGAMGSFAQKTADEKDISREQMDAYAIESLRRAKEAIEHGYFTEEITPITLTTRSGEVNVLVDEQPGNARPDKIPQLRPAFAADGTITAANSSSISDGAAAMVIMSAGRAKALGLTPLAKILGHASHASAPSAFTRRPSHR